MSWITWQTSGPEETAASANSSAEESAPPEQATSVRRPSSRVAEPPVSDRHDATIARTTGSRRVGFTIRAFACSASLIVPSYDARMPSPSRTHRSATDANPGAIDATDTSVGEDAGTTEPSGLDPAALGGSNTLAGLLMAGGVLIITFILMSRLRRKRMMAPPDVSTSEQIAAIRARAGDRNNIDAFKADVHDFTRQMAGLLDSKAERLEQLIADADDRLSRLEASGPDRSGSHRSDLDHAGTHRNAASQRSATPPRTPPDLENPDSSDPLHDRIYRLADSGLDPIAIARETGQPTGQVELILALRA